MSSDFGRGKVPDEGTASSEGHHRNIEQEESEPETERRRQGMPFDPFELYLRCPPWCLAKKEECEACCRRTKRNAKKLQEECFGPGMPCSVYNQVCLPGLGLLKCPSAVCSSGDDMWPSGGGGSGSWWRPRWARYDDIPYGQQVSGYGLDQWTSCWPCFCPCLPGQPDATQAVNNIINAAIMRACDASSVEDGLVQELIRRPRGSSGLKTRIEQDIEDAIKRGDIPANQCVGSASALKVCGVCIGTDKIGHFFEEGLFYSDVENQVRDAGDHNVNHVGVALAAGYLLEGLDPLREMEGWELSEQEQTVLRESTFSMEFATGPLPIQFGDGGLSYGTMQDWASFLPPDAPGGPPGASEADLAANEAGFAWWTGVRNRPMCGSGSADSEIEFDICDWVTDSWDEMRNVRRVCCPRPRWL